MYQPVADCQLFRGYDSRESGPLLCTLDRLFRGLEPVRVLGVGVEVVGVHRRLECDKVLQIATFKI